MQLIDLFSGIGGFSLSATWLNWKTIQFCENNDFCKEKLKRHWPDVPIHDDIKTLTAEHIFNNNLYDPEEKTIVTGGVPCQPWSNAGKRQGESDIRNLWPETIRFIGLFRPDFALLENVPGLLTWNKGFFFENICTSLENEGYEIWPFIIPSASIGAWDKRDRVWIIAHNNQFRCNNEQKGSKQTLQNEVGISQVKKQSRREQQCGISESIKINSDIDSKGMEGHARHEFTKRQKDEIRRNGQANWLRNWIEVASELCRSNARVPSELDEVIKIYEYGSKNANHQETISKIDLFRGEILRDMWCEKHKVKQTSFKTRPKCYNDIMHAMPYQYTYERWKLGERIKKDKILCDLWNRILSTSFEETQDLQSEMLERVRKIECNEKAGHGRTNRIKALGNSANPYVVYNLFKCIDEYNNSTN